jgi:nucleoid-associated protein YgaU
MAQAYQVRDEFKNYSLDKLMEGSVQVFHGVGDIQGELLKQYFDVTTVPGLANLPAFLSALEIQELALGGGALASKTIREISRTAQPKFRVRESALDLTPQQLMLSSVQDLEGVTPAQDLALYNIFRVSNISQLAQNRIMLDARLIQTLHAQGGSAGAHKESAEPEAGETAPQVRSEASVSDAAQRIAESRASSPRDERSASAGQEAGGSRTATIASRRTTVGSAIGSERGAVPAPRGPVRTGAAALSGPAPTTPRAMPSRAAAVMAARAGAAASAAPRILGSGSSAPGGRPAPAPRLGGAPAPAGRPGSMAGRGAAGPSPRPGAGQAGRPGTAAAAAGAPAEKAAAVTPPPRRTRIPPGVWVIGVVVVVAIVLFFALRPREQPAPPVPATTAQPGAPGGVSSLGAAKTIHTVRRGQSLWRIAERYYEIGSDWTAIFKENQDQIAKPDLIYPDQQFKIPPKP